MKRLIAAALLLTAPAFAQPAATEIEVEGRGLMNRWIAAYNKGDAAAMAADVYAAPDTAKLEQAFADLRAESFGNLDVYDADFCRSNQTEAKAILRFARIYTFGGKMNDDEAKIFDLVRADSGWRISSETDAPYDATISCF